MIETECIFCRIIQREAPAGIVYEDQSVVAFLSNRPVNIGHLLVVPKRHYVNIYEMSEDEVAYVFKIAKVMADALKDAFGTEAVRIAQNNGADAAQVILHMHVHVIPMNHQNKFRPPEPAIRPMNLLDKDAQEIRRHL